jgi:hypothetical protein
VSDATLSEQAMTPLVATIGYAGKTPERFFELL